MLRPGDRVYIDGTGEEGLVMKVRTNEVVVRVRIPGGYDLRRYAHENLRFEPVMRAASPVYA